VQTTLEVAEAMHYPACYVWLSQSEETSTTIVGQYEKVPLSVKMQKYIADSAAQESYPILEALEKSQTPIIIWGAGSFAQRLFTRSPLRRCNIIGIVDKDSNKQGMVIADYTVTTPEALIRNHPNATILVAAAVQFDAITKEAQSLLPTCNIVRATDK